jgi:HK97 gp10 family phage protein
MANARATININIPLADNISQAAILRGVRGATVEAKNLVIDKLSQPGKGRLYSRGVSAVHRASTPGAPPAVDTGRLRGSTQSEVTATPSGAVGEVSVNTEYAAYLEFGTEKIAPRPFMSAVLREGAGRIRDAFVRFARIP